MLNQSVMQSMQSIDGVDIGIDKIQLGLPLCKDKGSKYPTMIYIKNQIADDSEYYNVTKKYIDKQGHSALSVKYKNSENKGILTVVAGTKCGMPYVSYYFNPSKLTNEDWQDIERILEIHFAYGLHDLLELGTVRKLEFYVDLLGVHKSTVVPLTSRRLPRHDYVVHNSITNYYGNRNSTYSLAIYDKRKQLSEVEKIDIGQERTRVEVRLIPKRKGQAMTLKDITDHGLPNPWAGNVFVPSKESLHDLLAGYKSDETFYHKLVNLGLYESVAGNKPAFKKIVSELPEHDIPQYRPHEIWPIQMAMMKKLMPPKLWMPPLAMLAY